MPDLSKWQTKIDSIELSEAGPQRYIRALRVAKKLGVDQHVWPFFEPRKKQNENNLLTMKLLINQGAEWKKVSPLAWAHFREDPSSAAAARLVEVVVICGTIHECLDVLAVLNEEGFHYYYQLSRKLRESLCLQLWKMGKCESLDLFIEDEHNLLLPIEKLYLVMKMLPNDQVFYLKDHFEEIYASLNTYGNQVGIDRDEFMISVSRAAIDISMDQFAKQWLETINAKSPAYVKALPLLMNRSCKNEVIEKLESISHWKDRLSFLKTLFEEPKYQASVQSILIDVKRFFPLLPNCMREISELFVSKIDGSFSYIFQMYESEIFTFHSPPLADAIWRPLLKLRQSSHPLHQYWYGVAKVHLFAFDFKCNDIFAAKKLIQNAQRNWALPVCEPWERIFNTLFAHMGRTRIVNESVRAQKLSQLKIVASVVNPLDIEVYINGPCQLETLRGLVDECSGHPATELLVWQKIATSYSLRNEDLKRIWHLCNQLSEYDLGWRVLSLCKNRGTLDPQFEGGWSVCGEKRSHYPFLKISNNHLDVISHGMSDEEAKAFHAFLGVGHKISDLFARESGAKTIKSQPGSIDHQLENVIAQSEWAPKNFQKRLFFQNALMNSTIPDFIQILPENTWTQLLLKIFERLGLDSFQFSIDQLKKKSEMLFPKGSTPWLKTLDRHERSSWYDLLGMKMNEQQFQDLCVKIATRMSTMIYPSHYQALQSIQKMRLPVGQYRDFEGWLVSQPYQEFRKSSGLAIRIAPAESMFSPII